MHGRKRFPVHRSDSSTYLSKRSKSPSHHLERGNSPSRHRQRRESRTRYFEKNSRPHYSDNETVSSRYLERSMSPSHYSEKNRSRSRHLERSRSSHSLERNRSPSHHSERNRSPHYLERNRSPSRQSERTRSPHYLERNRSPSRQSERTRSPHYLDRNRSPHYLERNRSPSHHSEKSTSPHYLKRNRSHSVERSESPYFGGKESPFHYPERVESPDHYLRKSESPQYLIRSETHSPPLDGRYEPLCNSNRDELSPRSLETAGHADTEQHKFDGQHSADSIGEHYSDTSKARSRLLKTQKLNKVKSLEELERMTDREIKALKLSGAAHRKLQLLLSQGVPRKEAKRTICKESFIRNHNEQSRLKSETSSTSQIQVISSAMSHESAVSQFAKGKVKGELGESSSSQNIDILVQMSSKRNISEGRRSYLERNRSPHYLERNRSPSRQSERPRSPYYLERTRSPSRQSERTRSPYYLDRNRSPHYLERNRSPSHHSEKSTSPHYLERNRSPFNFLVKSNTSSHSVERSESPYFGGRESPFHYPQRVASPDHYLRKSESPQYPIRREMHSPPLEGRYEPLYNSNRDELSPRSLETEEHADTEQHNTGDSLDQHYSHTSKARSSLLKAQKLSKVKSLEELERMTDQEINALKLSGASQKKLRLLVSQGVPRMEAKRTIFKANFIRNHNEQLGLKSETSSTSQIQVMSSAMSHELAVSQFAKGKVKSELWESSSSQNMVQMNKKPKIEDSTRKVAVVHTGYPMFHMDFQKLKLTKNAIMSVFERLPATEGPQVRFKKCQYKPGYLLVTCVDEPSANWLKKVVSPLQPWKGAVLQAIAGEAISKHLLCLVFVPDENEERLSEERILNRLRIGNRGLNSHLWTVVGQKAMAKGQLWTFAMDENSLEVLKTVNMKPYFGFSTLKFKVMSF